MIKYKNEIFTWAEFSDQLDKARIAVITFANSYDDDMPDNFKQLEKEVGRLEHMLTDFRRIQDENS